MTSTSLKTESNRGNSKLRLLLVDDEPTVRGVIVEQLQEDGYHVETACDGLHGLERFMSGRWDVIITDRVMPRMDGDHLATAIKKINPNIPIILITAFADRSPDPSRAGSPFDIILRKPFAREALRAAISSFVLRED